MWISSLLLASSPYVNDRARGLSDAANRDTERYREMMPYIWFGLATFVVIIAIVVLVRNHRK